MAISFKLLMAMIVGLVISFAAPSCNCLAIQKAAQENIGAHASHQMPNMAMADAHDCKHGCDGEMQDGTAQAVLTFLPVSVQQVKFGLSAYQWPALSAKPSIDIGKMYAASWHAPPDITPISLKIRLLT